MWIKGPCLWECKLVQTLWRRVWRFLKKNERKLKIELSYDLAIPSLEIYLKKIMVQKYPCTPVFIASVFIIAKTWKKSKGLSTDKWIKKMWYIYSMEYYSGIKKSYNAICSNMEDLEIILNEVRQKEEDTFHMKIACI